MRDYAEDLFSGKIIEEPKGPKKETSHDYAKDLFEGIVEVKPQEAVGGTFQPTGEMSTITGKPVTKYVGMKEPEASFGALLKSSFADDPFIKAKIFSESRGIPMSRYRVNKTGQVEFKDDEGKWQREVGEMPLSKVKATAAEALGHPSTYLAPAGAATMGPLGAAGGGMLGEGIRKGVAKYVYGEEPGTLKTVTDVAMQGILALGGEMVGKMISGGANRFLSRGAGILKKSGVEAGPASGGSSAVGTVLDPADHAKALWIKKLAEQHDIHLAPHQLYDKEGLTNMWKYLRKHPLTADKVRSFEDTLAEKSQKAIEGFISDMGGYQRTPSEIGGGLKETSEKIIRGAEKARTEAVSPKYERAFDKLAQREAEGDFIDLTPALSNLDKIINSYPQGRIQNGLKAIKVMLTKPGKEIKAAEGPYGYLEDPFVQRPKETLLGWIREKGGIHPKDWGEEFSRKETGVAGLSNQKGRTMDELLAQAVDEGWAPPGTTESEFVKLIKQDIRSAKTGEGSSVVNLGREIQVGGPKDKWVESRIPEENLKKLQKAMFEINDLIEGTSYEAGQISPSSKKVLNSELEGLKKDILGSIERVAPEFIEANKLYESLSPPIEKLKKSVIGELTRMKSDRTVATSGYKLLDVKNMPDPQLLMEAKKLIAGREPELWMRMVGGYIRDVYEGLKVTEEGKIINAVGKLQKRLFGTGKQRQILEAAMGPQEFETFRDLMTIFQRASIGSGRESMTAPFLAIEKQISGQMGSKGYELVSHPTKTITDWTLGKYNDMLLRNRQGELFRALTSPDVVEKMAKLKKLAPGSRKLIEGASVLGTEILDRMKEDTP